MTPHTDAELEAVLTGGADGHLPVELRRVAGLVRAAHAEPAAAETDLPPGLLETLVACVDGDDVPVLARRRASRIGRKVAVVATSVVLASTGAAAATGHLPEPVQGAVARAAGHVGVDLPRPASTDGSEPEPPPTTVPPSSAPPPSTTTLVRPASPPPRSRGRGEGERPTSDTPAATAPGRTCTPPAACPGPPTAPAPPTTGGPPGAGGRPSPRPAVPGPPPDAGPPSSHPTKPDHPGEGAGSPGRSGGGGPGHASH